MRVLFGLEIMDYLVHGLLRGLERQGHEVRIIPLRTYPKERQAGELVKAAAEFHPDLMLTPGWSIGHFDIPEYQRALSQLGLYHVYWATEDPVFFNECSMQFVPFADYVFTTTEEFVPRYAAMGKPSSLLLFGCNPEIHHQTRPDPRYAHDLILVANNYHWLRPDLPFRRQAIRTILLPLIEQGFDVKVFGVEWTNPQADIQIPPQYHGGFCPYLENSVAYSSAKIVLGVHWDNSSQTQSSIRTYEVLGSGAFYLTMHTPAHEHLFENGRHLVWSKSPEETVDLVRYYLAHPEERERIAAQGQQLVYEKHTYDVRAREFEQTLSPLLARRHYWGR